MADSTHIRGLFRRVQHPQLQDTVKGLEVRDDLDRITYPKADNQLTAAVSNMPEYQLSQNVSGVHSSGGNSGVTKGGRGGPPKGGHKRGSIYKSQGKVYTDYCQNWKRLSEEDYKTVRYERKKKGKKSSQTESKKDVLDTKRHISELSLTLTEMKASIAAFSGNTQGTNSSESKSGQESPVSEDAVNSFGVYASKRNKD